VARAGKIVGDIGFRICRLVLEASGEVAERDFEGEDIIRGRFSLAGLVKRRPMPATAARWLAYHLRESPPEDRFCRTLSHGNQPRFAPKICRPLQIASHPDGLLAHHARRAPAGTARPAVPLGTIPSADTVSGTYKVKSQPRPIPSHTITPRRSIRAGRSPGNKTLNLGDRSAPLRYRRCSSPLMNLIRWSFSPGCEKQPEFSSPALRAVCRGRRGASR
jgi:hypothetical protein